MFGVLECLLSDHGANLLSHLMIDLCELLGINTTSYHPQCNGMVERFNRTLKKMFRKHAGRFGLQWDGYLLGMLWAYRNTPHESTTFRLRIYASCRPRSRCVCVLSLTAFANTLTVFTHVDSCKPSSTPELPRIVLTRTCARMSIIILCAQAIQYTVGRF